MLKDAIILAGGLGTRLQSEVKDVPKPMAPIANKPYLAYQIDFLINQGIRRFVFSVGYMYETIQQYFGDKYKGCSIVYAVEKTQLGTGGAIINALQFVKEKDVLVVNGDSLFLCNLKQLYANYYQSNANVCMALKPMHNIDRYGTVCLDENNKIVSFTEKQPISFGLVNMGTYIFNCSSLRSQKFPVRFSIEKDFFANHLHSLNFTGYIDDSFFLDIGTPANFRKAQYEIGVLGQIDKSWTLFLDRDGVINEKRDNDYVKSLSEFKLLPHAAESIANLSRLFGRVIIVTNQQGVGKGLMSSSTVNDIHQHLKNEVSKNGGHIDAVYFAPQLASEQSAMRKPQTGMAKQAQLDYPEIAFNKSIMVGDSLSDMEFAKLAGMHSVLIGAEIQAHYSSPSLKSLNEKINSLQALNTPVEQ